MESEVPRGDAPRVGTASVEFSGVSRNFGGVTALQRLDLKIEAGEFLTLLGPSGCGKTTALRMLAGFLLPSSGRIIVDGRDVTALPPQKRGMGMVFQDYALFPHLTASENIAFGLVERRKAKAEIGWAVASLLETVSLAGFADRYPSQLSGGQKQRVAVARALAINPRVLLMDEPLGALDVKLRVDMQSEIRRLQRQTGVTTLYVTHDQEEAFNLSDRIVVMNHGRIMQVGLPADIYERPASPFVADFVGKVNLFRGVCEGAAEGRALIRLEGGAVVPVPLHRIVTAGAKVVAGVRPEHVRLRPRGAREALAGRIVERRYAGDRLFLSLALDGGAPLIAQIAGRGEAAGNVLAEGAGVAIDWPAESTFLWPEEGD